ncbi:IS3 family transposase [Streptomyces osmaniensis]|nr:hypothetical protein KJK32_17720 [Streptomyces sp. JCM17656]
MPAPRKYPLELRERAVRMHRAAEPKPVIRRMVEELGVHHEAGRGRVEANLAPFEYIDGIYNPRRIQKRLGYLSPIEFEEKHYVSQAAAEQVNLKPRQPTLTG